ncbi:unnamed protein product [Orchesella dallaii]|uniref:Catalase core domain-containing protein n=1 Tax=Orchesella dallaii TaxID=48710 RepID=A0ABP1RKA3_9HEXA
MIESDSRGFAVKFYTEDGNWDLVGNNTPIFFVRDPLLFPSFIHTQKRNPQTHLKDADMFWDFITMRPETTHQLQHPQTCQCSRNSCLLQVPPETDQGIKNLPVDTAHKLSADDPDYSIHDLYNAISEQRYPSWSMYIQVMTFEQAERFRWNPFDLTKVWPHAEFPLIPVGKLVLDRNPANYFAEVEQLAFSPANMIPGIEPLPDKMLQARFFSYTDTHRHRLGPNYAQTPVNCPLRTIKVRNYSRDGFMSQDAQQGGSPNYFPNSFGGPNVVETASVSSVKLSGDVQRYNSADNDNFSQVALYWNNVLTTEQRKRLAANIAGHLKNAQEFHQQRAIKQLSQVHPEYGRMIQQELEAQKSKSLRFKNSKL